MKSDGALSTVLFQSALTLHTQSAQSAHSVNACGQFSHFLSSSDRIHSQQLSNICLSAAQPVIPPRSVFIYRLQKPPYGSTTTTTSVPVVIMPACPPLRTVFSEYCSNTELAINHIALSPRRASRRRSARPPRASSLAGAPPRFGLCARHTGGIVNPASFPGPGDWVKAALLELSIRLFFLCASHSLLLLLLPLRRAECGATRRAAYQQRRTGSS